MCGISGVFGAERPEVVSRMLERIVHRGPDDGHVVSGSGFTMGARRLSIIDLSHGRQPLTNEDERIWGAQNGEIYNFELLQDRLTRKGHSFRTRCDTEVIVHLFEERGADFVHELEGMFALAVFDARTQTGMLARDRAGKKPLYYAEVGNSLYFASEIKALLAVPEVDRSIDWEAIHHFLSFKHVPAPWTAFRGIRMLGPAHVLRWGQGGVQTLHRYWRPSFAPMEVASEEECVEALVERLEAGVRRRLVSDVPVGFFLSGGLDSSLVTAIAARIVGEPVRTFTLSYDAGSITEGKRQDLEYARRLSRDLGTRHFEEEIRYADFPDEFPRIIGQFDEPFSGVVSTWFLARLISRHVKVALSGDGADELFGSYLSHRLAQPLQAYASRVARGDAPSAEESAFEGRPGMLERLHAGDDFEWRYRLLTFSDEEKQAIYSPSVRSACAGFFTRDLMRTLFADLTARDPLNRVLEAEFLSFFPDQVLTFVDRLSMAHSLEVRAPFLDTGVMELSARIPAHLKIREGETKYLLKQAALRYLPPEIVHRPKEGFVMPINEWLLGNLRDYVGDMLGADRIASQGYFDADAIDRLVQNFYAGDRSLANKILSLLAFQAWHDACLTERPVDAPRTTATVQLLETA